MKAHPTIVALLSILVEACQLEPATNTSLRSFGTASRSEDDALAQPQPETPYGGNGKGDASEKPADDDTNTGDDGADTSVLPVSQLAWDGASFRGDAALALIPVE